MPEEHRPAPAPVEAAIFAEPAAAVAAVELSAVPEPAAPAPAISRVEPAVATAPVAPPAPAPIDVDKALQESGLVLVQTDPSKVKLAEPPAEPQFVPARPRPRRTPPPDSGPLQIVETRKDA